jgi:ribosome-binding factor A
VVSTNRAKRIADRIREELSEMMIFDIQDPRLTGAYITDVSVDRELAFADIYVFSSGGSESADEVLTGFNRASGFLRSELARRVDLRTFPKLRFHWDPTPERAEKIEELIDSLDIQESPEPEDDQSGNE